MLESVNYNSKLSLKRTALYSNLYSIQPTPDWVKRSNFDLAKAAELEDSPFNYPLVDYQNLVNDEQILSYQRTVQCINDSSRIEDASLLVSEIHHENQKILFHHLLLIRNGQTIDALDEDNISAFRRERSLEQHITDNRITVSLSIDDLRQGDIIDYAYSLVESQNDHPVMGKYYYANFWFSWGCPVFTEKVRVINQSSKTINVLFNTAKDAKQIYEHKTIAAGETFIEERQDILPESFENAMPSWFWGTFIQLCTESSWEAISSHLYEQYSQSGVFDEDLNLFDIENLDIDESSDLENEITALKIIRFVQNKVRYKGENHGIYTHTPKSPSKILAKRAGDCKDKSTLLVSLLKSAGIKSNLLLVHSNQGEKIKFFNPSPYHFNHMVVQVHLNGQSYFFDPTIQKQSGDLKHSAQLRYAHGLTILPKGGDLIEMPLEYNLKVFELNHFFDFTKTESKDLSFKVEKVFYRHRADNMRNYFSSQEKKRYQEEFFTYARNDCGLELEVITPVEISSDDSEKNILKSIEEYRIVNLEKTHKGKKIEVRTDFYLDYPIPYSSNFPVGIKVDGESEHNIYVKNKWQTATEPTELTLKNKFFEYSDSVKNVAKNEMHYQTVMRPNVRFVEAEEVDTYKEEVLKVKQRCINIISYKKKKSKFATGLNVFMIYLGVVVLLKILFSIIKP